VFDDADLDAAVDGALASKYRNTGQTCVCANRLLVQDKVYDAFAAKLTEKVKAMKVGNGMEPGSCRAADRRAAVKKVEEHVADAIAKGAKLLAGASATHSVAPFSSDCARQRQHDDEVTKEETSARWRRCSLQGQKEAIRLANDTEFGLASYFYGRDLNRMWRVASTRVRIVGINTGIVATRLRLRRVKESASGRRLEVRHRGLFVVKYLCMVASTVVALHIPGEWSMVSHDRNLSATRLRENDFWERSALGCRSDASRMTSGWFARRFRKRPGSEISMRASSRRTGRNTRLRPRRRMDRRLFLGDR